MRFGRLTRAPRRVMALFLAVTVIPAAALGLLAFRVFELDRKNESRRITDTLDSAADLVVSTLHQRLAETAQQLASPDGASSLLPVSADDALIVTFGQDFIQAHPAGRLIYYPVVALPAQDPSEGIFEPGEAFEFKSDYASAISIFKEIARSSKDRAIQAGALLRLARSYRNNQQPHDALRTYEELERLGSILVRGTPVDLMARKRRCAILADLGRTSELHREVRALNTAVESGYWPLDFASYALYFDEASLLFPPELQPRPASPDQQAMASAVETLWATWEKRRHDEPGEPSWRSVPTINGPMLAVWQISGSTLTALLAGPGYIKSQWEPAWTNRGLAVSLVDPHDGHVVLESPAPPGKEFASRPALSTRLPWTVRVSSATAGADSAQAATRQRLMLAGFGLMALLTLLGGVFTAHAAKREFAVARLQSDFVSAVSHEFRTPLTSLGHLTELLSKGVIATEDRRQEYYAVMALETERLKRLVEGLLDFGRMEAIGSGYAFERLDPTEVLERAVANFQASLSSDGHRVELTTHGLKPKSCTIRGNREALTGAIRNLLENAVRYSPNSAVITVEVEQHGRFISIHVHDDGFGIPAEEQKIIFDKFVRGSASKALNVPGTGIGLAMAQHIVRSHGGEIHLKSETGSGTTFTIQLPAMELNGEA